MKNGIIFAIIAAICIYFFCQNYDFEKKTFNYDPNEKYVVKPKGGNYQQTEAAKVLREIR